MRLYTIGFTKKSAQRFFALLKEHGITRVVDIRLHPGGQLAGFAKGDDLPYFLHSLAACDYVHLPLFAPTAEIMEDFRKDHDWPRYVARFQGLLDERDIPAALDRDVFTGHTCCLLCSEDTPNRCHRRLVAERLAEHWPGTEVIHLL
jgi:uncharacterized protein (DUF488 family)